MVRTLNYREVKEKVVYHCVELWLTELLKLVDIKSVDSEKHLLKLFVGTSSDSEIQSKVQQHVSCMHVCQIACIPVVCYGYLQICRDSVQHSVSTVQAGADTGFGLRVTIYLNYMPCQLRPHPFNWCRPCIIV